MDYVVELPVGAEKKLAVLYCQYYYTDSAMLILPVV